MNLSIATWNDQLVNIQVDSKTLVQDVKAILEAETGIPIEQQALIYGTRILADSETLRACGVSNGDVLQLMPAQQQQQQPGQQGGNAAGGAAVMEMNPDGSAKNPAGLMAHIRGNPHMLSSIQENNPNLAKAIRDEDIAAFQETMRAMHRAKSDQDAELQRYYALADADPLNPEVQQKIEELIHQKNIQESYENAMEHAPEHVVGQVHMLYCNMEVNGVPVKMFIDSGAQMTIMTQEFAEKCYLTRLIDKRFHGMAMGVGSSKIVGRIHQAPMKVGGHYISSSVSVLEQKTGPQCIFGLDNLKRHLCCIDLQNNVLAFGSCDARLPFLSESEIPTDFSRHVDEVSEEEAKRSMDSAVRDGPPVANDAAPSSTQPAPAAPPAAGPAAAGTAPAAAGAGSQDAKVAKLMALGFSKEQCEAALKMTGGNEEYAASVLFDQMM